MHHLLKVSKQAVHEAAEELGERRATVAGQHVKPKIGAKKGKEAAATLGTQSHKHHEKKSAAKKHHKKK